MRLLLRGRSGVGGRQVRGEQLARHLEGLIGRRVAGRKAPQRAGDQHDQDQAGDDGQVDFW